MSHIMFKHVKPRFHTIPYYKHRHWEQVYWWFQHPQHSARGKNAHGTSHRVTLVTTLDGERVVVDWGIGQLGSLPEDMRLCVRKGDL